MHSFIERSFRTEKPLASWKTESWCLYISWPAKNQNKITFYFAYCEVYFAYFEFFSAYFMSEAGSYDRNLLTASADCNSRLEKGPWAVTVYSPNSYFVMLMTYDHYRLLKKTYKLPVVAMAGHNR